MTNKSPLPVTDEPWRINPDTPSVIITPHGRIAINWSVQRPGEEVDYALAEETAAMIVETVNGRLRAVADADQMREALEAMVYETTSLSPMEPNGDHWCRITAKTLAEARAVLTGSAANG